MMKILLGIWGIIFFFFLYGCGNKSETAYFEIANFELNSLDSKSVVQCKEGLSALVIMNRREHLSPTVQYGDGWNYKLFRSDEATPYELELRCQVDKDTLLTTKRTGFIPGLNNKEADLKSLRVLPPNSVYESCNLTEPCLVYVGGLTSDSN